MTTTVEYLWRSVNKRKWPTTGNQRHLVKRGHTGSLCGTSAMPASLWQPVRGEKPDCGDCVSRAAERNIPVPS